MSDTYNGWTNYETWRVNLEIFDSMDCTDIPVLSRYEEASLSDVADYLEEYADQIIFECEGIDESSLCASYARSFLSCVNWREIASHFVNTWNDIMQEEEREQAEEEAEND